MINLAKDIFEFNGWSSAIRSIENGFVDEFARTGKVSMCLSVTVRRVVHTIDVGYGHIENYTSKAGK